VDITTCSPAQLPTDRPATVLDLLQPPNSHPGWTDEWGPVNYAILRPHGAGAPRTSRCAQLLAIPPPADRSSGLQPDATRERPRRPLLRRSSSLRERPRLPVGGPEVAAAQPDQPAWRSTAAPFHTTRAVTRGRHRGRTSTISCWHGEAARGPDRYGLPATNERHVRSRDCEELNVCVQRQRRHVEDRVRGMTHVHHRLSKDGPVGL